MKTEGARDREEPADSYAPILPRSPSQAIWVYAARETETNRLTLKTANAHNQLFNARGWSSQREIGAGVKKLDRSASSMAALNLCETESSLNAELTLTGGRAAPFVRRRGSAKTEVGRGMSHPDSSTRDAAEHPRSRREDRTKPLSCAGTRRVAPLALRSLARARARSQRRRVDGMTARGAGPRQTNQLDTRPDRGKLLLGHASVTV